MKVQKILEISKAWVLTLDHFVIFEDLSCASFYRRGPMWSPLVAAGTLEIRY